MSTGGSLERQAATQNTDGGQLVGKNPSAPKLYQPPAFMGKSGQPDNQTTSRPKGNN